MVKRREDLTAPRAAGGIGVQYDADAFGQFSESIARFLGTARFLVCQTVVIVVWIAYNLLLARALPVRPVGPRSRPAHPRALAAGRLRGAADPARPEPPGAARPRAAEHDRDVAERTQADTEFLAREIAGVRLMLADVVTGEELRDQLDDLINAIDLLTKRLDELAGDQAASGDGGRRPSRSAEPPARLHRRARP